MNWIKSKYLLLVILISAHLTFQTLLFVDTQTDPEAGLELIPKPPRGER
jgi:hypothetical protein